MNRRQFLIASAVSGVALIAGAAGEEPKLRVAVIGHTGHGDYGHGLDTMWQKVPDVQIVAVADADPTGLAHAVQKLRINKGFADYRQMLAQMKPDIVAVSPRYVGEHRDMALAAAGAGVRGIYVEKAFCRTLAEADEIIAACQRGKVKLAVAHRNRYHPTLSVVDRLLKEGVIGKLTEIRGRGKEDARGGALDLWVLGSHVLNLATFLAGKPQACSAVLMQDARPATPADVRDGDEEVGAIAGNAVHARFDTERGVPIYFDSIANAGEKGAGFGLQLIGTKAIIDLRLDVTPIAHLVPGNPFQPQRDPRPWIPITTAGPGKPEPIADLAEQVSSHKLSGTDLVAAIREDRQPICNATEARLTIEMITAVFASHVQGGARVAFPLQIKENPLANWKA